MLLFIVGVKMYVNNQRRFEKKKGMVRSPAVYQLGVREGR